MFPEVIEGTTAKYANFELVDPEKWVPDGYICLRVDLRGAGRWLSGSQIRAREQGFGAFVHHDIEKWRKVVEFAGIKD